MRTFKLRMDSVLSAFDAITRYDQAGDTAALFKPKEDAFKADAEKLASAATALANGQDADFPSARAAFEKSYSDLTDAIGATFVRMVGGNVDKAFTNMITTLGITLAVIIPALLLIVYITLGLTRRFKGLDEAMTRLGKGDRSVEIPYLDDTNETGRIAATLARMKQDIAAAERSKAEQTEIIVGSIGAGLEHLSKGDVTHRVTANLSGPFAKLKDDFNIAMDRLQDTLKNVLASTGQITTGASVISAAADDLSRRTEHQAASLEETAAALEEITATVKKTANNAKEARASVTSAQGAAEAGGSVVNTAIKAMDAISQSSKQITDIIGVIDEIAFQTNLLALNAGVEAARAGDAGKGFAVVASEVRALAQRSSEAAKQIKTLINASGEQVGSGVKLVGESGLALRQIMDQVQQINGLVTEMAQAAEQQSVGIEQVNTAVSQMDQVTQQNAAMVEQSTAASRNLASETKTLTELVGFFSVGHSHFTAPKAATRPTAQRVAPPGPMRTSGVQAVASGGRTSVAVKRAPAVEPRDDWTEF